VVSEVVDRLVEDLVVAWKDVEGDVLAAASVFVVELLSVDETSSEPRSSAISSPCELDVVLSRVVVVDRLVVAGDVVDSSSSKASVELASAVVLVSASVVDSVVVVRPFEVVPSSSNSSVVVVESGDVVVELDSRLDVDSSVTDVVSSSS